MPLSAMSRSASSTESVGAMLYTAPLALDLRMSATADMGAFKSFADRV